MKLPKIDHPLFKMIIPSTQQPIVFRPFLVKEEKILLFAAQSGNPAEIARAIQQVITNCVQTEDIDISELPLFDIEYIFLKIRSASVNNIIELEYVDDEDGEKYKVSIDLEDVKINYPDTESTVEVNSGSKLYLKYPKFSVTIDIADTNSTTEDQFFELIKGCLDKYVAGDEVYYFKDCVDDEINGFLDQLDSATFGKIKTFIRRVPTIEYKTKYVNSKGTTRHLVLDKLTDFFTFA